MVRPTKMPRRAPISTQSGMFADSGRRGRVVAAAAGRVEVALLAIRSWLRDAWALYRGQQLDGEDTQHDPILRYVHLLASVPARTETGERACPPFARSTSIGVPRLRDALEGTHASQYIAGRTPGRCPIVLAEVGTCTV